MVAKFKDRERVVAEVHTFQVPKYTRPLDPVKHSSCTSLCHSTSKTQWLKVTRSQRERTTFKSLRSAPEAKDRRSKNGKKDIQHNDCIQFTEEETRKVITGKWKSQNAKPSLPDSKAFSVLQQRWKKCLQLSRHLQFCKEEVKLQRKEQCMYHQYQYVRWVSQPLAMAFLCTLLKMKEEPSIPLICE